MPALSEYSNVYDTAIAVLHSKGFRVWYDDSANCFCAERDGWDFVSESPCGLLGLISIYEFHQPKAYSEYWWRIEAATNSRNLPNKPPSYTPVWRISQNHND